MESTELLKEIDTLETKVKSLELEISILSERLDSTWITSESIIKRSFAVWWHIIMAYITVVIFALILAFIVWVIWWIAWLL